MYFLIAKEQLILRCVEWEVWQEMLKYYAGTKGEVFEVMCTLLKLQTQNYFSPPVSEVILGPGDFGFCLS